MRSLRTTDNSDDVIITRIKVVFFELGAFYCAQRVYNCITQPFRKFKTKHAIAVSGNRQRRHAAVGFDDVPEEVLARIGSNGVKMTGRPGVKLAHRLDDPDKERSVDVVNQQNQDKTFHDLHLKEKVLTGVLSAGFKR